MQESMGGITTNTPYTNRLILDGIIYLGSGGRASMDGWITSQEEEELRELVALQHWRSTYV